MADNELQKLQDLLDSGFIQQPEYEERLAALKAKLADAPASVPQLNVSASHLIIEPTPVVHEEEPEEEYDEDEIKPRKTTVQMSAPKRSPPPRTQAADPFPPLSRDNSKRSVSPPAYRAVSPPRMNSPLHSFHTFVGHSTLVVMPPPDMWAPIVEIKKNHMNPRIKRPPYPHVSLLAPFVPFSQRQEAYEALRAELRTFQPFTLRIRNIKLFYNDTSFTLYLDPETEPAGQLEALFSRCRTVFPEWPEHPFEAHIGIGYFKNKLEAEGLQKKYQSQWKPYEFVVKEIYLNTRTAQDVPWEVRKVIPLGPNETAPHFPEKPE